MSKEELFKKLNLRPMICEEGKVDKKDIDPADDVAQTISTNIQSLDNPLTAPNTGFESTQFTGLIFVSVSVLAIISMMVFKK